MLHINRPWQLSVRLCPLLLVFTLFSCVTIHDSVQVTPAGLVSNGALFSHTLTGATGTLSFDEFIDFLEAQAARSCVPVPGLPEVCLDDQSSGVPVKLPARGGAICMSATDWATEIQELEQACRELGNHCKPATAAALSRISASVKQLRR